MTGVAEGVIAVLTLLAALALTGAAVRDLLRWRRDRMHLKRLADRGAVGTSDDEAQESPAGLVVRRLRAAGLRRLHPLVYLASSAVLGVLALLGLRRLVSGMPVAAAIGGGLAVYIQWLLVKTWGKRRARRFEAKLADAVGFMVGALTAGENLSQAFASTAETAQGVARKEFKEVAHRLRLGMPIRQALRRMEQGYDCEGTRLFTRTVIAKWQAGGDLAPVLDNVGQVIRERLKIRWRVQSHMAGARVAVGMSAAIPYLLIPFFLWQRPDWIARLRDDPLGPKLLLSAVLVQIVGLLWMRRILRIEL